MFIHLKLYILNTYSGIASTEAHITLPLHVYVQLTHIPQTCTRIYMEKLKKVEVHTCNR